MNAPAGLERKIRILVADDMGSSLKVIRDCLEDEGYEVHTATNTQEALDMFGTVLPDLVFLDYNSFGYMTGADACRVIKGMSPATKVVGFSGQEDIASVYRARGADGYLARPLSCEKLLVFRDILDGKQYFDS